MKNISHSWERSPTDSATQSALNLPRSEWRQHYSEPDTADQLARQVGRHISPLLWSPNQLRKPIFLCIGTDRSTGDALGPLVGTFLLEGGMPEDRVYGTLASPVHATNLAAVLSILNQQRPRPLAIAIDACLGQAASVGMLTLGTGALRPGAGVKKELPAVGDIYLTGNVNTGGFMEYFVLQNTRLSLVMDMARVISRGLLQALL